MTKKKLSPWNNNLKFIQSLKPEENFNTDSLPKEPNYSETKSWAAFPGIDGFQNLSPDNPLSLDKKEVDVFFIHPTGYFEKQWNGPIDETSAAYERTGSHLASQVSAFSDCCIVYAPFYRQATYYSFFDTESNNGCNALDLAYSDLSNAFEVFIKQHNNGKPFFIAGHSQGALHGQRLVNEYVSKSDSKKTL